MRTVMSIMLLMGCLPVYDLAAADDPWLPGIDAAQAGIEALTVPGKWVPVAEDGILRCSIYRRKDGSRNSLYLMNYSESLPRLVAAIRAKYKEWGTALPALEAGQEVWRGLLTVNDVPIVIQVKQSYYFTTTRLDQHFKPNEHGYMRIYHPTAADGTRIDTGLTLLFLCENYVTTDGPSRSDATSADQEG